MVCELIFSLGYSTCVAQKSAGFIGLTEVEIRNETGGAAKFTTEVLDNGTKLVYGNDGLFTWIFSLENGKCFAYSVIPDNSYAMNMMVKINNEKTVTVSSTEWKMYTKDRIINIKLRRPEFDPSGPLSFYYTLDNGSK